MLAMLLQLPERSRLESMLRVSGDEPWVLATALGVAFFLGAAHALTPGHGKAVVAAYLAGSRGRIGDAVYLGSVVTVTHTASVFVLGLITLYASQRIALERLYPRLALASGILVTLVGAVLLWRRWRQLRSTEPGHRHSHHHGDEGHHHHHHHHPHPHRDSGRAGLLSLGVAGGLVPCPEALVVLLLSVSLGRILFGLSVLVAFSLGLAAVLIGIGCAMVYTGPLVTRWSGESAWTQRLPVASAAVVILLGLAMLYEASGKL